MVKSLAEVVMGGLAGELDYMSTDEQSEALDRFEFLRSCDEDELADAADFIALAHTAERIHNVRF